MRCAIHRLRAFSLIEMLVVITIIALLIGLLLPVLRKARDSAKTAMCLSNVRCFEIAHWTYMTEHKGRFIDVGLGHGAEADDETVAWINTLQDYYGDKLLARSPVDTSPHWGPGGVPLGGGKFRRTSYGINNALTRYSPGLLPRKYTHLEHVPRPSATVHFVYMAHTGSFAGADHPHIENWTLGAPSAAQQLQINAHGGPPAAADSVSNYGFLDGHAETLPFHRVWTNFNTNRFRPDKAQ